MFDMSSLLHLWTPFQKCPNNQSEWSTLATGRHLPVRRMNKQVYAESQRRTQYDNVTMYQCMYVMFCFVMLC